MLSDWMLRLRALFRRTAVEHDIDDELRFHFDHQVEAYVARGLSRSEAVRRTRLDFGGLDQVKEEYRDALGVRLVDGLWGDLRLAVRALRATPIVSAVAALSLALGIGANTAIFSICNSLLLRTLPVSEPERLVTVYSGGNQFFSYATWDQIRQRAQPFDSGFAWSAERFNLAQTGERQLIDGLFVSGDFFASLGVPALLGRTFTAADDVRAGGGPNGAVAVISYGLWQRRFGGADNVIGTPLVVQRIPFTIVGVTPPEFFGVEVGRAFDVALPIGTEPLIRGKATSLDRRGDSWLTIMLRLSPTQTLDSANATLRALQPQIREAAISQNLSPQFKERFLKEPFTLTPAAVGTSRLRQRYERPLVTIMVVVALVLLIACANVASVLLARATARRRELSLRLALGAPSWRLARQLLVESLVLAGIGAAIGILFASWGSRFLVAQLSSSVNRVFLNLSLDWHVLAFTAAVTAATVVLFGTAPAFRATLVTPIDALMERGRLPTRIARMNSLNVLVVAQVALSLVLVVAAGLFVRTFQQLASLPLGFDNDRVLVVNVDAPHARLDVAYRLPFYQRLIATVASMPGVANAAGSIVTPVSGGGMTFPVEVPGAPELSEQQRTVMINFVTPGWLATYGTAIHTGRDINDRDTKAAPQVVLVNDAFVRRFFSGRSAIGETVAYATILKFNAAPKTVVGVVSDAVYVSLRNEVPPTVYVPLAQWDIPRPMNDVVISVRSSSGPPVLLARSVAAALSDVDRDLTFSFRALEDQVNASLTQERLVAMLAGFFGGLALLLAGLGLYGVTAYGVSRRRSEIGIRIALGASRTNVVRLVVRRVAVLVSVGVIAGTAASLWLSRFVAALLYRLEPRDPMTLIGAAIVLGAVGLAAASVPASRASRIDPAAVLRES